MLLCRDVRKSPAKRYGKPVMVPSSDSGAGSDAGQGQACTSDGDEDTFPASYQPPLSGLMSKGSLIYDTPDCTCLCTPVRNAASVDELCMQVPCMELAHHSSYVIV